MHSPVSKFNIFTEPFQYPIIILLSAALIAQLAVLFLSSYVLVHLFDAISHNLIVPSHVNIDFNIKLKNYKY